MKLLRDSISALAGIGLYIILQAAVDWNTRQGEVLAAQACVKQMAKGKWTPVKCAVAKR